MSRAIRLLFGGRYDRVIGVSEAAAARGLDVHTEFLPSPTDAFAALSGPHAADGGEMSVSFYMRMRSLRGRDCELVALPVWTSRAFRHGNIVVRGDSNLTDPRELIGRRISLPEYGMTMAVWLRGILADEYGIKARDIHWVTNRLPAALGDESIRYPSDVEITCGPADSTPFGQLRDRTVDAVIGAGSAPPPVGTRRLIADVQTMERDYFHRTRVFPVMHVLVLRRRVIEQNPGMAEQLFHAFDDAKLEAQRSLWSTSVSYATLPWTLSAVEEQTSLMGDDPWPYGIDRNLRTLTTLLRYMSEQRLLWDDDLTLGDYFLPFEPAD